MQITQSDIDDLHCLYNIAENILKEVGNYTSELTIPSINQLRCAGQHIIRALKTIEPEEYQDSIAEAKRHCTRAIFDAAEVGLQYSLNKITSFRENYQSVSITDVLPDYIKYLEKAKKARDLLDQNNSSEERGKYCDECYQNFLLLKRIVDRLDTATEELAKIMIRQRRNTLLVLSGIALAFLVGVAGIIINFYIANQSTIATIKQSPPAQSTPYQQPAPPKN
ncbi:MAG: hypothetical protein HQ517_04825 [SAR324 cluster bacterium]|nr:hypothetical protein [SAR324 cluster bacterium]